MPFEPGLRKILLEHKAATRYTEPHDFVFQTARRTAWSQPEASREFKKLRDDLGLSHITFHILRHCYASAKLAQGETIARTSRLLGHASPTITLGTYTHVIEKAEAAANATVAIEHVFGISAAQ